MWFWHTVALALGGRTVAEWQACMTQAEFEAWREYFRQNPFDDFHRFHRPAALIARAAGGAALPENLRWLAPEPNPPGMSDADARTLAAFGRKPPTRH